MWVALGLHTHLLNTGVCKMRSWSLFAVIVALLSPLGVAKANNNGGVLVTPDTCTTTVDANATVLLNGVLSALTHVDIDIGVDEHLVLATAEVELDDLLAQVMVEVGADSLEDLLSATVDVEDVLHAMIHLAAEDGNLSVVAALEALELDLGDIVQGEIDLGDLFDVSDLRLVDGVTVDLLGVTIDMLSLWDQHHVVEPTTISIDGEHLDLEASIASATIDIEVGYPPHIIVNEDEISAEMGSIELQVHADLADVDANLDTSGSSLLGAKLMLGHIDLCVFAPWISVRGDVINEENGAAFVDATVGRIHMCIGTPINGAIGEGNDELDLETEITPSLIGEIVLWVAGHEVPVAKVWARAVVTAEADATAVLFEGEFPACMPLDLGPSEADLWAQLFANVEITVEPLGIGLSPIQLTVLQNAAAQAVLGELALGGVLGGDLLDGLVLPSLDILGSGLGSIDISVAGLVDVDLGGNGGHDNNGGNDDDDDGIGVDVDVDADVDVSIDEDVDVGVDTDVDVGVDLDMDGDSNDGDIDADVDADIDVDADEDGANAEVDVEADVDADLDETMAAADVDANGALNLAGGGCSVGGVSSGSSQGLAPLALLGLTLLLRARRRASRS